MAKANDPPPEPVPIRPIQLIGQDSFKAAFIGLFGTRALEFLKGMSKSPKGMRIMGGLQEMRKNPPDAYRNGVMLGLLGCIEGTAANMRNKEDSWNWFFAGATAGGIIEIRHGLGPAFKSAMLIGVCGAMAAEFLLPKKVNSPPQQSHR
ncbi:hypothetical protein IFM89_004063 [Coptis chinensis]|uniref:Mitochondrial import inner membrane translocase subunit TIM22 n=1 Tax=Coptis chinensis TaxID=261450 RepID=A0A835H4F1_9MAGN|nr:hypothetical protein IFM89_004063 [Coptis chinensis]